MPSLEVPRAGEVLLVRREASVQFVQPLLFRMIRALDWPTYDGWAWLDGYVLNKELLAVERRSIFVQPGGLRRVALTPQQTLARKRRG
ncbi:hypothetical protein ACI2K4_21950 [Micromonospora sp. NPDC050397]|uniref:hypothetical protein n=1 Tax=Micromonospora sp. NPDC050397 TaxID=3364279 RepID=UPI00384F3AE4